MIWLVLVFWVLGMSIVTLMIFWWDKRRAIRGGWRVSEASLLMLALFGGWPGAKYAQTAFRHKTRKQPFAMTLNLCGLVLATLIVAVVLYGNDQYFRQVIGLGPEWEVEGPPIPRRFGPGSNG